MKLSKTEMESLASRQATAYNSRDLDSFCACYHQEVEVYRNLGEPPTMKGLTPFRESYSERFAKSPNLHCEIKNRIVLERTVVDEEIVTGLDGHPSGLHVVAIYGFRDGLISHVWFAR